MSFVTDTGPDSFGATHFWVLDEPAPVSGQPDFEREQVESFRHIPGGDRNIAQLLGNQTPPLSLSLALYASDYPALKGQCGAIATLSRAGFASSNAVLLSVTQPRIWATDIVVTTATFRSLS